MKRSVLWMGALIALVAATSAAAERMEVPTVRLSSEIEIAAPPAAVWAKLTSGESLVKWCPMWKTEANGKVNLTKVGDTLEFNDSWGNAGRSIVTFYEKDKELRMAHEPANGSYMCQAKMQLTQKGDGTLVRYTEAYTDESSEKDREATAVQATAEMKGTLTALKAAAEKQK